jgi:hypothetical protein
MRRSDRGIAPQVYVEIHPGARSTREVNYRG